VRNMTTDSNLFPAASAALLDELGIPAPCGVRRCPQNRAFIDINAIAAEVAILRDRADEEETKAPSRRRVAPATLRRGADSRAATVRGLVAALPPHAHEESQ
jgi:hypothetical protein